MSDAAFKTARYPGNTVAELEKAIAEGRDDFGLMRAEIARREAVAQGDESRMTPGERLRYIKAQGGR